MTVHKDHGRLLAAGGELIGEGRAFIHLRLSPTEPQAATGTLSLDWWDEAQNSAEPRLQLAAGPLLVLRLQSDRLSSCMVGRILRYEVDWPGQPPA